MEQRTKKILGVNLGIFAAYTLLSFVVGFKDNSGSIFHAFFIVAHVIISLFIGLIRLAMAKNESDGGAYLLAAVLILVIGFGTCVGLSTLIEQLTHRHMNL